MFARSLIVSFALLTLVGCKAGTDVGAECVMTKRDPARDGGATFILESEIKVGANKDFVSFGSTDCDDLTCVRDSTFVRDPDPNAKAKGYCSRVCTVGTTCPSSNPADDEKASTRYSCRALLLDEDTLRNLCGTEPEKCQRYFGGATTPYFCARGQSADAGT